MDGKSDATAEDSVDPTPLKEKAQEDEAADILRGLLTEGRRPAKECAELLKIRRLRPRKAKRWPCPSQSWSRQQEVPRG